ncbi:MAG: hypothetical protein ACFNOP_08170, partial [Bacteroides sp.]
FFGAMEKFEQTLSDINTQPRAVILRMAHPLQITHLYAICAYAPGWRWRIAAMVCSAVFCLKILTFAV